MTKTRLIISTLILAIPSYAMSAQPYPTVYPTYTPPQSPTVIQSAPYVPSFRYYRYGTTQNKLKLGRWNPRLNPNFVALVRQYPESSVELDRLLANEQRAGRWGYVSGVGLLMSLGGLALGASNLDTERIEVRGYDVVTVTDSSKKNAQTTGWILAGVGLITTLVGVAVAGGIRSDSDQSLLNIVNQFNEKSEKKIELIIASQSPDDVQVTLARRF